MIPQLYDGPEDAPVRLVLAHGAGAGMESRFMRDFARAVAGAGVGVVRFEFPYMAARRGGTRRPPDPAPMLMDTWLELLSQLGPKPRTFIGGKSMGGRIASMVADRARVAGLVCLGYPFHPPGRPDRLRTEHLARLATPTLIIQGTRDEFGTRAEVATYELSPSIRLAWLQDADHSFIARRGSGRTSRCNFDEAVAETLEFIRQL